MCIRDSVDDRGGWAQGISGDPISDGMNLPLNPPPPYAMNFADILSPSSGAAGAFVSTAGSSGQPFNAVRYPDAGDAPFRTVFFAFPFEAISTSAADGGVPVAPGGLAPVTLTWTRSSDPSNRKETSPSLP